MIVPVILCGGSGTRLWPLSRRAYPKQLLNLVGDQSLLQQTVTRLEGIPDMAPPLLISNEEHRFLVAEQMREIGVEPQRIILEPVGKNTAPAVCLALEWAGQHAIEATLLILPSDHVIEDLAAFQHAVAAAVALADQDYLVTFGIAPTSPETGYGYVERGNPIESLGFELQRFVEKPSSQLAAEYIASGQFSWNGGMFAFKRQVACDAFKEWAKPIADAVKQAWSGRTEDLNFSRPDSEGFAQCPSDSIDYAVMEHVKHAAIVPMDAGWSDLGSWSSVWDI
ncbi:MAG: sugar phosphate nucleotidyltransferase, partial [Gammaproteobacteria bacterium]